MKSKSKEINKYFLKNKIQNVLLSISGGVDSILLLDILLDLKKNNKKLYSLKLHLLNIKLNNKNFEHNARKARYSELLRLANEYNYDKVLTAHNYNDQIETLVMKDNDNSNWISRIGIRKINEYIYRPLLDIDKKQIYNYAKSNSLIWIEDLTNKDISFKRNKTRFLISNIRYKENYFNYLIILKNKSDVKYLDYLNKFKKKNKEFILRKN